MTSLTMKSASHLLQRIFFFTSLSNPQSPIHFLLHISVQSQSSTLISSSSSITLAAYPLHLLLHLLKEVTTAA